MSVPSRTGNVGDLARMLARLVGPGVDAPDNSLAAADYLAFGDALDATDTTTTNSGLDAFPSYAVNLLTEWERLLGLPTDTSLTDAARQLQLTETTRTRMGGSPQRILRAVWLVDGTATLEEVDAAAGPYRFVIVVSVATFTDPVKNARLRAILGRMKPAYTQGLPTTQVGFLCDDARSVGHPGSVCDDTVLSS